MWAVCGALFIHPSNAVWALPPPTWKFSPIQDHE
jgi:hypothetical protein